MRVNNVLEVPFRPSCTVHYRDSLYLSVFQTTSCILKPVQSTLKILYVSYFCRNFDFLLVSLYFFSLETHPHRHNTLVATSEMLSLLKETCLPQKHERKIKMWCKNKQALMFCNVIWLCVSLSVDCWVESVSVCRQQKRVACVQWRDRFPSADNEAPFPHEEAVSISSPTAAACARRLLIPSVGVWKPPLSSFVESRSQFQSSSKRLAGITQMSL